MQYGGRGVRQKYLTAISTLAKSLDVKICTDTQDEGVQKSCKLNTLYIYMQEGSKGE